MNEFDRLINLLEDYLQKRPVSTYDILWAQTFVEKLRDDFTDETRRYHEKEISKLLR